MSNIVPIDQAARAISPLMRERMAAGRGINSSLRRASAMPSRCCRSRARCSAPGSPARRRRSSTRNTRQPIAFLDVVLVNASPNLAKTYYIKGFTEGDMNPPDCWSLDCDPARPVGGQQGEPDLRHLPDERVRLARSPRTASWPRHAGTPAAWR